MDTNQEDTANLPIKCDLSLAYAISLTIAALMVISSIAGLLCQTVIYPTEELLKSFVPNNVVNLSIGLPILLGSMCLARRGKLIGLLLLPGALFYVFYSYIVYIFSMPLNVAFLLHITLVTLSAYLLISLVASIDGGVLQYQLAGSVPERAGGIVLTGLGVLFFVRVVSVSINALISQTLVTAPELALHVTDFMITTAWVIGGVLL